MTEATTADTAELDVIFGEFKDRQVVSSFVQAMRESELTGTLYLGYPVLSIDDEKIEFDAVLVSHDRGVVIFDLYTHTGATDADTRIDQQLADRLERLYAALYNRLNSFSELRSGRRLAIEISTAVVHPIVDTFVAEESNMVLGLNRLDDVPELQNTAKPTPAQLEHLNAAIQRISNLKPRKKRDGVTNPDSMGAIIKEIEKKIANLDLWQKRGSIEYVEGPQRIRGLAGSGKTVVLALKAAYLHVKRPDWTIVVTFATRSLYQQFESLLTRFVYAQIADEPDWEKIKVMHAWGGSDRTGVYKEYAMATGIAYRDFGSASRAFGYDYAFAGACNEAYSQTEDMSLDLYDMMLIDEAQDLPSTFFKICYRMVKDPKRIVWAYDDLQNLTATQLPSAKELFGTSSDGQPLVELENLPDQPTQDIVLPRCYRNPPWTLLAAHGLGFGIHRAPMAQMFTDLSIWRRLGYQNTDGPIVFDHNVQIERAPESIPSFFSQLLSPDRSISAYRFDSAELQYSWVAQAIKNLLDQQELEHSDFLVILPNVLTNKSEAAKILKAFISVGLIGHVPGQTSSRDELFREGSIAITHVYRAKGNEAPMVFVVNADYCESVFELKQRRNILFTSITRSRAWVCICGVGPQMDQIILEFDRIRRDNFALTFHYPTQEEAARLAVSADNEVLADVVDDFEDVRTALRRVKGKALPADIQRELAALSGGN